MASIVRIGNSQGIIIPKNIMKALNLDIKDELKFILKKDEVIIKKITEEPKRLSAKEIRSGWLKEMKSSGKNIVEDLNIEDWEWNE